MAKVGTFENKKVRGHLRLCPLGPHRRRLAVRSGTSKGSTISRMAAVHLGHWPSRPNRKKKKKENFVSEFCGFYRGVNKDESDTASPVKFYPMLRSYCLNCTW